MWSRLATNRVPWTLPRSRRPRRLRWLGDLFRDECVRVRGTVVSQDADELVVEMKRGEYVQRVNVRDPSEVLEAIPLGRVVTLAGRLKVEEDGTYAVHFVPEPEIGPGVVAEPPGQP